MGESVQKNPYSEMQIMTKKTTTIRTLYVHVPLNGVICIGNQMIFLVQFGINKQE